MVVKCVRNNVCDYFICLNVHLIAGSNLRPWRNRRRHNFQFYPCLAASAYMQSLLILLCRLCQCSISYNSIHSRNSTMLIPIERYLLVESSSIPTISGTASILVCSLLQGWSGKDDYRIRDVILSALPFTLLSNKAGGISRFRLNFTDLRSSLIYIRTTSVKSSNLEPLPF